MNSSPSPFDAATTRFGPEAIPSLVETLREDDEFIRHAAAGALARIGPAAIPALRKALGSEHPNVRAGAALALAQMGPAAQSAIADLRKAENDVDPRVVAAASDATRKISGQATADL